MNSKSRADAPGPEPAEVQVGRSRDVQGCEGGQGGRRSWCVWVHAHHVRDVFRQIADIWRTSGIGKGTLCAV